MSNIGRFVTYFLLIIVAITMVFPFAWMVSTAIKPDNELYSIPPKIIPDNPKIENFKEAWNSGPFNRYLFNTVFVTVMSTLLVLLISSLGGVSFGMYDFKGKNIIFALILAVMIIPPQVTLIPNYLILRVLNWLNTYQGLIITSILNPFGIFLIRQYVKNIPMALVESARIDGCSEWGIFWKIILPQLKPVMATLAIFTFTNQWNSFLWPLIIMDSQKMYTLQVGLAFFRGQFRSFPNLSMAVNVVAIIPVVILFLVFQKYFVSGIHLTGIKE